MRIFTAEQTTTTASFLIPVLSCAVTFDQQTRPPLYSRTVRLSHVMVHHKFTREINIGRILYFFAFLVSFV